MDIEEMKLEMEGRLDFEKRIDRLEEAFDILWEICMGIPHGERLMPWDEKSISFNLALAKKLRYAYEED